MEVTEEIIEVPGFEELNFVKFYTAMLENKPELINVNEDQLDELIVRFNEAKGVKKDGHQLAAEPLENDIIILRSCLMIMLNKPNFEILEVIESYGIDIANGIEHIKKAIRKKLNGLEKQLKLILDRRPKQQAIDHNAYDIIATLSSALQMPLNSKELSVAEYIAYDKVAKRNSENIKKIKNNRNG